MQDVKIYLPLINNADKNALFIYQSVQSTSTSQWHTGVF